MLELVNLSCGYGAFNAAADLSLVLRPGTITALLGANGATELDLKLTVDMFQRRTSIIRLSKKACAKSEPVVRIFSEIEGLDAHGHSVAVRGL